MGPRDVLRVGAIGLRTRPMRAFLSALGIAIGIAAMIGVVGISSSSGAELDRQLSALGTNLLTVTAGRTITGDDAKMPVDAEAMIERIGPVESVSATASLDAKVYRHERIPAAQTGGRDRRLCPLPGLAGRDPGRGDGGRSGGDTGHRRRRRPLPGDQGLAPVPDRGPGDPVTPLSSLGHLGPEEWQRQQVQGERHAGDRSGQDE